MEEEKDILEQVVEWSLLYDFYGNLLKEQKKRIFEDYILNDYSLGELSSIYKISRQGIYDTVKRCKQELAGYEQKLGLIQKFQTVKEKVRHIQEAAKRYGENGSQTTAEDIWHTAGEILEEL